MSTQRRLAKSLTLGAPRSTEWIHRFLRLIGVRGQVRGVRGLLVAIEEHLLEFARLKDSYPACTAWVDVLSQAPILLQQLDRVALPNEAQAAVDPVDAARQPGAGVFGRFLVSGRSNLSGSARVLRAAVFLIAVMRQASPQRLPAEVGDYPNAWLERLAAAADSFLPGQATELPAGSDDVIGGLIESVKQAALRAPSKDAGSGAPLSYIDGLQDLRRLLRSRAAESLGVEVAASFAAAAATPEPVDAASSAEGDDVDVDEDEAEAEEDLDRLLDEDEVEVGEGEEAATDPVPQQSEAGSTGVATGVAKTSGKRARRPFKWGDRRSSDLPETYLLKEHGWAFNPEEQSGLTLLARQSLAPRSDVVPGMRPPFERFYEGIVAAVALVTGQTLNGACKVRIVLAMEDEALDVSHQLPRTRYLLLQGSGGGNPLVEIAFPPGDRNRIWYQHGVAWPLSLPPELSARIHSLNDDASDVTLEELLPFVAEGWAQRTGQWLSEKFDRSVGEVNLAIRHALARELYAASASRALIDLACIDASDPTNQYYSALSSYIHPESERNSREVSRAMRALVDPAGAPLAKPLSNPGGYYLPFELLKHVAAHLRAEATRPNKTRLELHNALATYTLALLVAATGHRHSLHMFHFPWDLDLEAMVAFICDKLRVGSEARFVGLARAAAEQVLIYRRHVVALISELESTRPELARRIRQAAGLANESSSGERVAGGASPMGQLFRLDGANLRMIGAKALDEAFETASEWADWLSRRPERARSVVRALRKNLATFLWEAGASGLQLEALLGHNREWHVYGEASTWSVLAAAQGLRPLIDKYLVHCGWTPTESVTDQDYASAPAMLLPDLAPGSDAYEGRQREGALALARAMRAVREALKGEVGGEDEHVVLDDADVDRIRNDVSEALGDDPRAKDKVMEVFRRLSARWRGRDAAIRISAASVNRIRAEPGPVEVGFARALAYANEIRRQWFRAAQDVLRDASGADGEAVRLAVILSGLVVHDGLLDVRQLWPLLESVHARESKAVSGRLQVRAAAETKAAAFQRTVYLSHPSAAAVVGLHRRIPQAAAAFDRARVGEALADLLGRMAASPGRKGWTLEDLVRVFRPWWFLRQPGFMHAIATGNRVGPSADAISEATLLGAIPPRLAQMTSRQRSLERRERTALQADVKERISQIFKNARGNYVDGEQLSRSQRERLRRLFDSELPVSLQALMSGHPIVELRVEFIKHLLLEGGLKKEHLAFNTIVGYDGLLASTLYLVAWDQDPREFGDEKFDELYKKTIDEASAAAGPGVASKANAKAVTVPDHLMTVLRTFHAFMRTSHQAPPSKIVKLPLGECRQSRPRGALLAPRLRDKVLGAVRRMTAGDPAVANAVGTVLLSGQSFGTRRREALTGMTDDFEMSDGALRLRVHSNSANKLKNPRAGRRVVPWPFANDREIERLLAAVRIEQDQKPKGRFLLADPSGRGELMSDSLVMPVAIASLRAESGNPAMNFHAQRHGYGTGVLCAIVPAAGNVAPCARIRVELIAATTATICVESMLPERDLWPFFVGRAAMWHGARVETMLDTYFHGATWILAEIADSVATDRGTDDRQWTALLGMSRTNVVKLRSGWRSDEGAEAETGWQRVVAHFVDALKLSAADVLEARSAASEVEIEGEGESSSLALTFTLADRLLVKRREEGLPAESLANWAVDNYMLRHDAVMRFLRAVEQLELDTGLRDFEPLPPNSSKPNRNSRRGVAHNSSSRQHLLQRLEILAIDEVCRRRLQLLAADWERWVDPRRPRLVARTEERLVWIVEVLKQVDIPLAGFRILVTKTADRRLLDQPWATDLRVELSQEGRFSRGDRTQAVQEYAVELDDDVKQEAGTLVRNANLHRAMLTVAAMLGDGLPKAS